MPSRTFDGTDDSVRCSIGACNIAFGTMAAIVNPTSDGTSRSVFSLGTSAGTGRMEMALNASNDILWGVGGGGTSDASGTDILAADGWALMCARKATGTVAPRMTRYLFGTNAFTHVDGSSSVGDSSLPGTDGQVRIGSLPDPFQWFPGQILLAGLWDYRMTDAEVETLIRGLGAWQVLRPRGLWRLNQAAIATPVRDLTGRGANQSSITGTAVSTDVPAGFGIGGGRGVGGLF